MNINMYFSLKTSKYILNNRSFDKFIPIDIIIDKQKYFLI